MEDGHREAEQGPSHVWRNILAQGNERGFVFPRLPFVSLSFNPRMNVHFASIVLFHLNTKKKKTAPSLRCNIEHSARNEC